MSMHLYPRSANKLHHCLSILYQCLQAYNMLQLLVLVVILGINCPTDLYSTGELVRRFHVKYPSFSILTTSFSSWGSLALICLCLQENYKHILANWNGSFGSSKKRLLSTRKSRGITNCHHMVIFTYCLRQHTHKLQNSARFAARRNHHHIHVITSSIGSQHNTQQSQLLYETNSIVLRCRPSKAESTATVQFYVVSLILLICLIH